MLKAPIGPIAKEWHEHQVTHTPPKPWCRYCTMGRGARPAHKRNDNDTEPTEGKANKISIDYMYLNDRKEEKEQPQLVMVDHNHGRFFAYGVPKKAVWGDAECVPRRAAKDIDNLAYEFTKVMACRGEVT